MLDAGLATALPATFLGVLLVRGLHAAPAADDPTTSRSNNEQGAARDDTLAGGAPANLLGASSEAAAAGPAPGSVLATAGLIDAGSLTRLSGEAHFPTDVGVSSATGASDPALTAAPVVARGGDEVSLTLGGTTELVLPTAEDEATETDEQPVPGDDEFIGNEGGAFAGSELNDQLQGGEGNDTLVVDDPWSDSLAATWPRTAGDGRATFVLGTAEASDFGPELASWRQQVHTDIENVSLRGDAGHDVLGDGRANVIEGDDGANRLLGRGGDDRLYGGPGDDWLEGGDGDDLLAGGDGDDWLAGGAGDDTYLLGLAEGPASVFDLEGRNILRLDGADLTKLSGRETGGSLEIAYDGRTIASVADYASHKSAWAGMDVGQGVRPLDDILGLELATPTAAAETDLLGEFLIQSEPTTVATRSPSGSGSDLATLAEPTGATGSWLTADSSSVVGSADSGLGYGFPLGSGELDDALRAQERSA